MNYKTDERLRRYFKDPRMRATAYYEPQIDEWIFINSNGIHEVIHHSIVESTFVLAYGYFLDYETWFEEFKKEEVKKEVISSSPCVRPWHHSFKDKIYFQVTRKECSKCGYIPDFGLAKGYEQCHKDYIAWKLENN